MPSDLEYLRLAILMRVAGTSRSAKARDRNEKYKRGVHQTASTEKRHLDGNF